MPVPKMATTTDIMLTDTSNSMRVKPFEERSMSRILFIGYVDYGPERSDSSTRMLCPSLVTVTTTFSIDPVYPSSAT